MPSTLRCCSLTVLLALALPFVHSKESDHDVDNVWQLIQLANSETQKQLNETGQAADIPSFFGSFLHSSCPKSMGGTKVTVILVADPGTFSGSPEAMHYIANLYNKKEAPKGSTMCASRVRGRLMGKPTVVIATGIGPVAAAVCTIEVLLCGKFIKEIFYIGTSGWSPQMGGVLSTIPYSPSSPSIPTPPNVQKVAPEAQKLTLESHRRRLQQEGSADGCDAANPSKAVNRIGDMCISAFAVNYVCSKAEYLGECAGYPNLCSFPKLVSGPNATELYGQCEFTAISPGTVTMATEFMFAAVSAASDGLAPPRDDKVIAWERSYFGALENGTGVEYEYDPKGPPNVFSYAQCVEVDGQFFYSGPPFEMLARAYAAETINTALGLDLDMTQVIAVSAMEAIGLSDAVERYNKLPGVKPLPYLSIRAMSNQLHAPVARDGNGVWVYNSGVEEDYVSGYKFAIASSSTALLNLFKIRCEEQHGAGHKLCHFHVAYP